jgi:hypothetical protein
LTCAVHRPPNTPKLVSLRDRRWTLAAAILGSSMAFLDATVGE